MNWLITTDLHLSDRPRDQYRFGLFQWIARQQRKHNIDATFLLGDLTENKDRHSSTLVNKIIEHLLILKPPIYILRGNHDGIDPTSPFFKFLNCIDGLEFVCDPVFNKDLSVAFIPHCKDQAYLATACAWMPPKPKAIMLHNTFEGAFGEGAAKHPLPGLSAAPIEALKPRLGAYSGDVHAPQRHGCVTYIGSPFQVRFGDDFEPRVLLIDQGGEKDLHFSCPRKWSLTVCDADDILNNEGLQSGDQVKLTIALAREEAVEWKDHKQRILAACKTRGLDVYGVDIEIKTAKRRERVKLNEAQIKTPSEIVASFCKAENTPSNIKQAGLELLGE